MVLHFLYCIDFPRPIDVQIASNEIRGWILCSHKILNMDLPSAAMRSCFLEFGTERPDVAQHFNNFPGNVKCGFTVQAIAEPIDLKKGLRLEVEVEHKVGKTKKISIVLDLNTSIIQEIEVDDKQRRHELRHDRIEKKLKKTLPKHPWITIRMDITNKCNLKCIMCHYKEEEIHSQPTKNISADQLRHYLSDIGPYVKSIMLSCGFEPLMSKHFADIITMLNTHYPQIEIDFCTNGMLMDSKARKVIMENNIAHVLLSFDGVTKTVLERIRVGASYSKIIGNIKALRDLKILQHRKFPELLMDFVLMNSNIHEAPLFVQLCAELGIGMIDFRHLVGNIYFSEHEEMLSRFPAKYNYYRELVIDASKKFNVHVRLPEPYNTNESFIPANIPEVNLSDFNAVLPDVQTEIVEPHPDLVLNDNAEEHYRFLDNATCLRPFNEIMIVDQEKILPCSYYSGTMGKLDGSSTLFSIFFNENFRRVRKKKMLSHFDHNCMNCPIAQNLLPTEIIK